MSARYGAGRSSGTVHTIWGRVAHVACSDGGGGGSARKPFAEKRAEGAIIDEAAITRHKVGGSVGASLGGAFA